MMFSSLQYALYMNETVKDIAAQGFSAHSHDMAVDLYEKARLDYHIREFFILDDEGHVIGILTRSQLSSLFGGLYGFSLHVRADCASIMYTSFLCVDENESIAEAARAAMARNESSVYDAIAVTKDGRYTGSVSVRDLLLSFLKVEVELASDVNPLTRLPGNRLIQMHLQKLVHDDSAWAVLYVDLDNFKAFNDAYGFPLGDKVILAAANAMKEAFPEDAFIGHVGGDDFVIICSEADALPCAGQMLKRFSGMTLPLYTEEDRNRGCIQSTDRDGNRRMFPLVSMSVALLSSSLCHPADMEELSAIAARTKKKAKRMEGNSIASAS